METVIVPQPYIASIAGPVEIPPESIECVRVKVQPLTKRKKDTHQYGSWLGEIDGEQGTALKRLGIALPRAIITVREGEAIIPLCNINGTKRGCVSLPQGLGRINIRPVNETYHKEEVSPVGGPREKVVMEIGVSGYVTNISRVEAQEQSIGSTGATSELPVKVAGEEVKKFPTRPKTEHLKELLEPEVMKELDEVLDDNEDLFMRCKTDIGNAKGFFHDIEILEGAEPHRDTYRRFPPPKREAADEQVQALLDDGVIEPSQSPFASAIVLVKKSDGSWRLCIDFRRLNAITKKDAFPLPRIDEALEKLGNARYFSTLDMGSAFWQVPLTERAKECTAFVTHRGQYQWNRMPFGLCNATATFQRLMSQVLVRILPRYGNVVLCYVDDVLIATWSQKDHVTRLRDVFAALKAAGLKLKAAKCELFKTHIKYLGRHIDAEGVRPDPDKLEAVDNWRVPNSKKTLASFLGFAGYYRDFIRGYAVIVEPLQKLKRKGADFEWGPPQQEAFDKLKTILMSYPVLALPTEDGEFVLDTDASDVAIAGILHQYQDCEGKMKLRVIAYASRTLDDCQKKYGAAKLEMFCALKMIEKFSPYLCMRKFILRVDCSALAWLKTYAIQQNSLAARWIARLEGFNFEVQQRRRELHQNADGLGKRTQDLELKEEDVIAEEGLVLPFLSSEQEREIPTLTLSDRGEVKCLKVRPMQGREEPLTEVVMAEVKATRYLPFLSIEQQNRIKPQVPWITPVAVEACKVVQMGPRYDVGFLKLKQEADPVLQSYKELLQMPETLRKLEEPPIMSRFNLAEKRWFNKNRARLFINQASILCLRGKEENDPHAIVLPDFFKNEILQETHESLGHQGVTKVVDKVIRHFVWPGVKCDAQRHVATCMMCQEGKAPQKKLRTRLKPITTTRVNQLVMIDFEQLTVSHDGYKGFLIMVDHYSKFTVAAPLLAFTAIEAARAVWEKWVLICGLPEIVHSDRGSQFESDLFVEVLKHMGCVKTHTSGYHPQGNGLAERMNKTITHMLLKSCGEDQATWTDHIWKVLYAYNTMKNATTGFTPFRLMHGREASSPLSMIFAEYQETEPVPVHEYVAKQMADMARISAIVRENVQQAQVRMARNHDKRMSNYPVLKVGQFAMRFTDVVKKKNHMKKLTRRWRGPFRVVEVFDKGMGYLFDDGKKAHYERVKAYEHRMKDLRLADDGEFHWIDETLDSPIVEIQPYDSDKEGGELWQPESDEDAEPEPGRHARLRKRKRSSAAWGRNGKA